MMKLRGGRYNRRGCRRERRVGRDEESIVVYVVFLTSRSDVEVLVR